MVVGDDLTLSGGHTMQHTDHESLQGTFEAYMVLLTSHLNQFNFF